MTSEAAKGATRLRDVFAFGLNPYGLAYHVGLQGAGGPRANPRGVGLKGFVAAIIGGLISYPLTAFAAIVVGVVEAFSSFYASNFKEVIVFTLILPVLILRSLSAPAVEEEKD